MANNKDLMEVYDWANDRIINSPGSHLVPAYQDVKTKVKIIMARNTSEELEKNKGMIETMNIEGVRISKLPVPGGWIYSWGGQICFVPKPNEPDTISVTGINLEIK